MTSLSERLHRWVGRVTWPFVAVLITGHAGVVVLYLTGTAVSGVPFRSRGVQMFVTSPVTPSGHMLAAVLLAVALVRPRWRVFASMTSLAMLTFYTAITVLSARSRVPPLGLGGATAFGCLALVALLVAIGWGGDDDAEED